MDHNALAAVVVTTDLSLRDALVEAAHAPGSRLALSTHVAASLAQFGEAELKQLRMARPDVVFLDFEHDAAIGLRLAQFLLESNPLLRVIAAGPVLSPELLMDAMRAGVSEYLPKPVTEKALAGALERIRRKMMGQVESAREHTPGQVYAVFSAKGGSGSTVVATNLAIHLHQLTDKRTLLVDLDVELGETALLLGIDPRFNFVDLVRNFHRMDAGLLASYIECHSSGVHLLSAPYHPDQAETVTGDQIRKILQFLRQHYDYIVVDTSKSFTPPTLAAFEQADLTFFVTTTDLASLRNIKRCIPLLDRIMGNASERLRLVVNRYHEDSVITLSDIERTLDLKVYATVSNGYEAVSRSMNEGKPLVLESDSAVARDLKALTARTVGIGPSSPEASPGLFRPLAPILGLLRRRSEKQNKETTRA